MMAWVPSLRSALRGTPHFDAVLALIAFAALLIDPLASHQVTSLTPLDGGLALVTAVPLVLRRRYPLGVLVAIVPLLLACLAVFHPDHAAAGIVMVVVFTVGLHGHRARALAVGALMAPVVAAGVLITSHQLGGVRWPRRSRTWLSFWGRWWRAMPSGRARNSSGCWPQKRNANAR